MINILFFAQLREQLQCDNLVLEIASMTNPFALRVRLINEHPHWKVFLENDNLLVAVNQMLVKDSHFINDGDEVAFFPPVTGG